MSNKVKRRHSDYSEHCLRIFKTQYYTEYWNYYSQYWNILFCYNQSIDISEIIQNVSFVYKICNPFYRLSLTIHLLSVCWCFCFLLQLLFSIKIDSIYQYSYMTNVSNTYDIYVASIICNLIPLPLIWFLYTFVNFAFLDAPLNSTTTSPDKKR